MQFPAWWDWEVHFMEHAYEQMYFRGISEIEAREMLDGVYAIEEDPEPGRWRVKCRWKRKRWTIIVEPQHDEQRTDVVTVFPKSQSKR